MVAGSELRRFLGFGFGVPVKDLVNPCQGCWQGVDGGQSDSSAAKKNAAAAGAATDGEATASARSAR